MIAVYVSQDGGRTWHKKVLMEGWFDKRTLNRLWNGETVDYIIGLFRLDPPSSEKSA